MIMTCANVLTIKMNNKAAATAAMATVKNVLATTSIKEPRKGKFAEIADCLKIKKNTISAFKGARTCRSTVSVPWPLPVFFFFLKSIALKLSASVFCSLNILHARSGPIVCELDGPRPIL